MKKIFALIILFIVGGANVLAQYNLKPLTPLGNLNVRDIKYFEQTNDWMVSDGYLVFKITADFSDAVLLFNTYPKFQFDLKRLPNKNYYSRHFDIKSAPFGFETRTKYLDSSTFYIMDKTLKKANQVSPSTFFDIHEFSNQHRLMVWGVNNCLVWGKDSMVFCNDGLVEIVNTIADKDSVFTIKTIASISELKLSNDGNYTAIGTADSGWYLIPSLSPQNVQKIKPSEKSSTVSKFYFDVNKQQIWVVEEKKWFDEFLVLSQYDYSNGTIKLIKRIYPEDLGITLGRDVIFDFNFQKNQLYVKYGLNNLLVFDLLTSKISFDFFGKFQYHSVNLLHHIYFNSSDQSLYLAGGTFNSKTLKYDNTLYKVEPDSLAFSNVVVPKSKESLDSLYPSAMHTVTNRIPESIYYSSNPISLSNNDLALIPFDKTNFLLYNLRNGNMIHSFPSVNQDLKIQSRFIKENTVMLSPNGKYIFEYLIKAGATYGISDTLVMALIDIKSGTFKKNQIVLSGKINEEICSFNWDEKGFPGFTIKLRGEYPIQYLQYIYLDSLLQPQFTDKLEYQSEKLLLKAWYIAKHRSFIIESSYDSAKLTLYDYQYSQLGSSTKFNLLKSPNSASIMASDTGFLLISEENETIRLNWFETTGKRINTLNLNTADYRINDMGYYGSNLFLTHKSNSKLIQLNLFSGKMIELKSVSKPGYDFKVSADEKIILSVSNDIQAWQIENDSLFKLYQLVDEVSGINQSQISSNKLVSDGKVWDLTTGMHIKSGEASLMILNDTLSIQASSPYSILNYLGLDNRYKATYEIAAHQRNFCKSLKAATDLTLWQDKFKGLLLTTEYINSSQIHTIYEVPFNLEGLDRLSIYPHAGINSTLLIKTPGPSYIIDKPSNTNSELVLLNQETGECSSKLTGIVLGLKRIKNSYVFFLQTRPNGTLIQYKTENNQFVKIKTKVELKLDSIGYFILMDEQNIATISYTGITTINLQSGSEETIRFIYLSGTRAACRFMYFDADENSFYVGYADGGIIKIANKKVIDCIRSIPSMETLAAITEKHLLLTDQSGKYHFINRKSLESDLSLSLWKGNSPSDVRYMWLTKENYYMATPGAENHIHFVLKNQIIPLKQGDLTFNRPDKVLEALNAPKTEIEYYYKLYKIRENKYQKNGSLHLKGSKEIPLHVQAIASEKQVTLNLEAFSEHPITQVNIVVNGCPVPLKFESNQDGNHFTKRFAIPLNSGKNTIYTWVKDVKGNTSRFDEKNYMGEFSDSGKWYFIGIGVSKYQDQNKNLTYADKDIRDIARFLSKTYPHISIDTLLNENVTKDNIKEIANKLVHTKPDDKVFISFSGHGLLDSNKQFWFATHTMDFNHPSLNGFSMNDISGMADKIGARYRMISIDACHSGDVISGFKTIGNKDNNDSQKVVMVGTKGTRFISSPKERESVSNLLKSMQLIFTDQLSNTGINLIAASSGVEYALEDKDWENGVFTYALLNGWKYGAKQNSRGAEVHYRDLKTYIQSEVKWLTDGKQTPNTVMENGEIDWWLIPKK